MVYMAVMHDPLRAIMGYQLSRTAAVGIKALNEALKPLGIRHIEISALLLIEANPGITQSAIGTLLHIERANMVPIVARLEQRGWVSRAAGYGKSIGLSVTPEALAHLPAIKAAIADSETMLTANMSATTRDAMIAALHSIQA
jgi:DNA-binding MarR family transcriptional regulator